MDDLISRQTLIDAFEEEFYYMYSDDFNYMVNWIKKFPSAEPDPSTCWGCNRPNCGARMRTGGKDD